MQNANKEIILDNYVWISRVGSDQVGSSNRLSVIGVGYYLKMYTKGRQLSCETSIHRFCWKNGRWGVLGHVDSESGIHFVIRQSSTVYGQVFSLNSVQSADSPTLKNADLKKFHNFFIYVSWFFSDQLDPIFPEITRPRSDLYFCLPTQH